MPAPWDFVSTAILGAQKAESDAEKWATQQREALSSSWANTQRSWLDEMRARFNPEVAKPEVEPLAQPRLRSERQAEMLAPRQPDLVSQANTWADEQRKWLGETMGKFGQTVNEATEPIGRDLGQVAQETIRQSDPKTRDQFYFGPPGSQPLQQIIQKGFEVASRPFNAATGVLIDTAKQGPVSPFSPEYLTRSRQTGQRVVENLAGQRADMFKEEGSRLGTEAAAGMPEGPLKTVLPTLGGILGFAADIAMPGPDIGVAGKVAREAKALGAVEGVARVGALPTATDRSRKSLNAYGQSVYRETSLDDARELLPNGRVLGNDILPEVYLSNTQDLAIGQGRNRGVLLEFDATPLQGTHITRKPLWEQLYQNGQAEILGLDNAMTQYQQALRAITIRPDAEGSRGVRGLFRNIVLPELEQRGWVKTANSDGSTTYRMSGPVGGAVEDAMPGPDIGAVGKLAKEAKALGAVGDVAKVPSKRFYHGTPTAFEAPSASRLAEDGLYGPGFYLTSRPEIAETYAVGASGGKWKQIEKRRADIDDYEKALVEPGLDPDSKREWLADLEVMKTELSRLEGEFPGGPNIRPINVPENLNLLDVEQPAPQALLDLARRVEAEVKPNDKQLAEILRYRIGGTSTTGDQLYQTLRLAATQIEPKATPRAVVNRWLQEAGFDGIQHPGGLIRPIMDADGNPVLHTVNVIFPESLPKIRNAISGTQGGSITPKLALGGAAATGAVPQQPGESDEVYRIRVGLAGAAGVGLGAMGAKKLLGGKGVRPVKSISPTIDTLEEGWRNPKPEPRPLGTPKFVPQGKEKLYRQMVEAVSNRGVHADKLVQDIGGITPEQSYANMMHIDPYMAGVVDDQLMKPVVQALGDNLDHLPTVMHLEQAPEIAKEMGKRAEAKMLARPIGKKAEARLAKRAVAKGAKVEAERQFSGGLTAAQATQEAGTLRAAVGDEAYGKLQVAAKKFYDFNAETLRMEHQAGLVSDEAYQAATDAYTHYSATNILKHMDDQERGIPGGKGASFSQAQPVLKRYTEEGTTSARENPITASLGARSRAWIRIRKNEVFQRASSMIDGDAEAAGYFKKVAPDAKTWQANKETTVSPDYQLDKGEEFLSGFRQGQLTQYVVPGEMRRAFEQAQYSLVPGFRALTSLWASSVTQRAIPFLAYNAFRDFITYTGRETGRAGGLGQTGMILKELGKAYKATFDGLLQGEYRGALADAYRKGVGMAGWTSLSPMEGRKLLDSYQRANVFHVRHTEDLAKLMRDLLAGRPFNEVLYQAGRDDRVRIAKDVLGFEWVRAIGERIEMGPRVASVGLAEKRGAGPVMSAIAGRDVTLDFKQGGWLVKALNDAIPFTNAITQVGASLPRMYRENRKGMAVAFATAAGAALAAEAWNRSDPQRAKDYADLPQWLKDTNLVFMLPIPASVDSKGNRRPWLLSIPTVQFAPAVIAAREIAQKVLGDDPERWSALSGIPIVGDIAETAGVGTEGRSLGAVAGGMAQNVSPFSSFDTKGIVGAMIPPVISPAIEVATDTNLFTGGRIASGRADEAAGPIARRIAPLVNARPSQVEFFLKDALGVPYRQVSQVAAAAAGQPSQYAGIQGVPVVGDVTRRFVRSDIGGQLDKAQDRILSPEVARALKAGGVSYVPTPVGREIGNITLTMEEQARYQKLANEFIDAELRRIIAMPAWQAVSADKRDAAVRNAASIGRDKAKAAFGRSR